MEKKKATRNTVFLRNCKNHAGSLNSSFIFFKDEVRNPEIRHNICCSHLNGYSAGKEIDELRFSLENRNGGDWYNPEGFSKYLHFVLNQSIFKDVFITKMVPNALKYGVKMNLEYDSNHIFAAFFMLRCAWEFNHWVPSFFKLVEAGIDKNVALVACQYIEFTDNDHIIPRCSNGHTPFKGMDEISFINTIKKFGSRNDKNYPVKKGTFKAMRVNDLFVFGEGDRNYVGYFYLFNEIKENKKKAGMFGGGYNTYQVNEVINKLKELEKKCL